MSARFGDEQKRTADPKVIRIRSTSSQEGQGHLCHGGRRDSEAGVCDQGGLSSQAPPCPSPLFCVACDLVNYLNRHPVPAFPFSQQGLAPWCLFHWPPGRPQRMVVNLSPGSQFSLRQTHREVGGGGGGVSCTSRPESSGPRTVD